MSHFAKKTSAGKHFAIGSRAEETTKSSEGPLSLRMPQTQVYPSSSCFRYVDASITVSLNMQPVLGFLIDVFECNLVLGSSHVRSKKLEFLLDGVCCFA